MHPSPVLELNAFVPAKDFNVSKQFYSDIGFELAWGNDEIAMFQIGSFSFLLQDFHARGAGRTRVRVGNPRMVAVLQPCTLVRAPGRYRPDGRRGARDIAHRSRIHCERDDGDDAAHLRYPGPEPRLGSLGRG